jgi:uncharacterized cofD-like protein
VTSDGEPRIVTEPAASRRVSNADTIGRGLDPQGPSVVALGGGYGLSTTLRAARRYASRITGVVSVADDGGSSGRLRRAFGIPAPGDLRRCLVALADESTIWAEAFERRFDAAELQGHPLGNIMIAGLTATLGDFGEAIDEALRLLGAVGRVVPATSEPVGLKATFRRSGGTPERPFSVTGEVVGEVNVGETLGLTSVSVVPPDPTVPDEALDAIRTADQICIGPGSLYTSVLAVASIPAIRDAVNAARGTKVYICNLSEQHPETTGYAMSDHVRTIEEHGIGIDVVLHDPARLPLGEPVGARVVECALADRSGRLHTADGLAEALRYVRAKPRPI